MDVDQHEPTSLFHFRGGNFLAVSRLADGMSWDAVERMVSAREDDSGYSVVVQGKLEGPGRRSSLRMNDFVQLSLTADTAEEGKRLLNALRIRVVPPDLLHGHVQACVEAIQPTISIDEVKKRLETMLVQDVGLHGDDVNRVNAQFASQGVENISEKIQEGIEKSEIVEKATAHTTKVVGSFATAVKMGKKKVVDSAELAVRTNRLAQTAQQAADITGAIAGIAQRS